jgi:hypothetical protein
MSTVHNARRNGSAGHKGYRRKRNAHKEPEMNEVSESATELFAFTIDAKTGQVVKLEGLDASGARHELTEEEKAGLAKIAKNTGLEEVVEQAFEAGIACVLGGEVGQDAESVEDAELRHMLLAPLIEHSAARHLMQRDVLNRVVLDTLIGHSVSSKPAVAEGGATVRVQ